MDTADAEGTNSQYFSQPRNHVALNLPASTSLFLGESAGRGAGWGRPLEWLVLSGPTLAELPASYG